MGKTWKIVLGLALALPMLAYVAGSLVAAGDEPGDRRPIEFVESPSSTGPADGRPGDQKGKGDSQGKDGGQGKGGGQGEKGKKDNGPSGKPPKQPDRSTPPPPQDGPEVVQPGPRDLDDDDDGDDGDDDDDAGDDDD